MKINEFGYVLAGGIIGVGLSVIVWDTCSPRVIPREGDYSMAEGYVPPSTVRITLTDVDGDGALETILRVGDVPYLLQTDVNGKPVLRGYTVTPQRINPERVDD